MKRKGVIALSGGRTSAFMLKRLLKKIDTNSIFICFCNTGREKDETIDFVHEIEVRFGIEIIWLEYTRIPAVEIDPLIYPHKKSQETVKEQQRLGLTTHWFKRVDFSSVRRRGTQPCPFDELLGWANVLPNLQNRMCSVQMKVRTMMRWMFWNGITAWTDYIGIRADEAHRALEIQANCPKYRTPRFPLIEDGITEKDVLDYWQNKSSFDLQLKSYQGNCDFCYLKAKHKRIRMAKEEPLEIKWWKNWETVFGENPAITGDGKYFRKGQPYSEIEEIANSPMQQTEMFEQDEPACGCGDKGFVLSANVNYET